MKKIISILLFYSAIAALVIRATPPGAALLYDAAGYAATARDMAGHGIISSLLSATPTFEDRGYSAALAILIRLFGTDNILAMQIANYMFWAIAAWFVYKALQQLGAKRAGLWGMLALFSPLFLTFSAKLYSEPFAAMGASLALYALVSLHKKGSIGGTVSLIAGSLIFFGAKSVFTLLIPVIFVLLGFWQRRAVAVWYLLVPLLLLPSMIAGARGGRSAYNLAIQASKVKGGYDEIVACVPYYLSYPVGRALLPGYEGVCHQNDPAPSLPRYADNPYILAKSLQQTDFAVPKWLGMVLGSPVKYALGVAVSMANIVLVEGVYPTVLLTLPMPIMVMCYLYKLALCTLLWALALRKKSWVLFIPLLYFVAVVGNFPVEPRYFYPLVPYLYVLAGAPVKVLAPTRGNRRSL